MRYWLLRTDRWDVRTERFPNTITVVSKRPWRVKEGDALVLMAGERVFTHAAKVATVSRIPPKGQEEPVATTIALYEVKDLGGDIDAEVLRYSLKIVRNLQQYWRHFQRLYRLLPEDDYVTIVRGEAFVARSTYYELLFALPDQLQRDFQIDELLTGRPRPYFERLDHDSFRGRLNRLARFVEERIVAVGRMLDDITESAAQLRSPMFDVADHAFLDEGARQPDSLSDQVAQFSTLKDEIARLPDGPIALEPDPQPAEDGNLEKRLRGAIENRDQFPDEARFENVFASST